MNKKILIGTILAVIIVLAGFSSVASAQKVTDARPILQQLKDRIEDILWKPGTILGIILDILGYIDGFLTLIFILIFGWMFIP